MPERIYIIDDEPDMVKAATILLKEEGYVVESSTDPQKGLREVRSNPPDLLLLDIRLPKTDGFQICKELKADPKTKNIPVVMVSVKSDETDVVVGLEVGAEDYIRKPYFEKELLARVKTVLRRRSMDLSTKKISSGPLTADMDTYVATANGKALDLTAKEFELFSYFLRQEGRVLTRANISKEVWGLDDPRTSRTIDFHVHQLRKKLGAFGVCIQALKGVGYRFEVES